MTHLIKLTVLAFFGTLFFARADSLRLDELDLAPMTAGWGQPQKNQSITHTPLAISGEKFTHGVGTHATSDVVIQLDGKATLFTVQVGVDDGAGNAAAAVDFIVLGDNRELWRSGVCKLGDKPRDCRVPLDGIKWLELRVDPAGAGVLYDHADWADAAFAFSGAPPRTVTEEAVILTPPAPREPRINGPKVSGVRPGSPFLYRIPCTGERPMSFRAEGLPGGLALDPQTGIITGKIVEPGTHRVVLFAKNTLGEAQREFRIVVGNKLALTPPMGWNSWYIDYDRVTEASLRDAADLMISAGMADYGYQYINSDDCWAVKPGATEANLGPPPGTPPGQMLPNNRFPDIKGMVDYIHAKGLKAGIYSSPGPLTCTGFQGCWQHVPQDARLFADWGFDFLKYDWCSYGSVAGGNTLEDLKKPYQQMADELRKQNRDIVFNLCQYGMGDVWKWGGDFGNCWRTGGDLGLEPNSRLPGFYQSGMSNASHWKYAGPGGWNDPDYILIGWVGDAHALGVGTKTTLTPNEQYSYMSMWSLMAAPLIFGGDMARLDPFTLNVLCNAEVIDVDQDPLGRQAKILRQTADQFVLVKDLEDGSKAVGLFNLRSSPQTMSVSWSDLGIKGNQRIRDLWRQKEIGSSDQSFEMEVPRHGVALVRVRPGPEK